MKKIILLLLATCSASQFFAQEITGTQLLDKAIQFHDPNDNWKTFTGSLFVTMETPDKPKRTSEIKIDLPNQSFYVKASQADKTTVYSVTKDACNIQLNGKTPTEEEKTSNNLSCDRASMYQNYYTYLYGLPMKLKDTGTIIDENVILKEFNGKNYLVLKVTYEKEVGKDTWYFYFDPTTYAMEVYQFYHEEEKNDGEFILLSGLETVNGIKLPKERAWYYNKESKYLGTDFLNTRQRYD